MGKDIHINNKIIKWRHFDHTENSITSIDEILKPLVPLFKILETNCDRLCCGIEAYNFDNKNLLRAFTQYSKDYSKTFETIIRQIEKLDAEMLTSFELNQGFHKSYIIELLNEMLNFQNKLTVS